MWPYGVAGLAVLLLAGLALLTRSLDRWDRLKARAEAAERAADWAAAYDAWAAYNAGPRARADSWGRQARAALALGRAARAEEALAVACRLDPTDPEPWLTRLELLRLEDRPFEARAVGWEAYEAVPPSARTSVLKNLTLALLAEPPADLARRTLQSWIAADADDIEARIALLRGAADDFREGDPIRSERIAILSALLAEHPERTNARELLVRELADAGEPERGRAILQDWPVSDRDARYERLLGRWALEYEGRPAEALAAFDRALADWPHDWRTHYGRARALRTLGREQEAQRAAATVARLREALDATRLTPQLESALARLSDPTVLRELADLCARVGLDRLAKAWRDQAASLSPAAANPSAPRPATEIRHPAPLGDLTGAPGT